MQEKTNFGDLVKKIDSNREGSQVEPKLCEVCATKQDRSIGGKSALIG